MIVREFKPDDLQPVSSLCVSRFGEPDPSIEWWLESSLDNGRVACFVAEESGDVLGFSLGFVDSPESGLDPIVEVVDRPLPDPSGVSHLMAVSDQHDTPSGLGLKLYRRLHQWFVGMGVDGVVAVIRHTPGGDDGQYIAEAMGGEKLAEVEEYYSTVEGWSGCAYCSDACECNASIYAVWL